MVFGRMVFWPVASSGGTDFRADGVSRVDGFLARFRRPSTLRTGSHQSVCGHAARSHTARWSVAERTCTLRFCWPWSAGRALCARVMGNKVTKRRKESYPIAQDAVKYYSGWNKNQTGATADRGVDNGGMPRDADSDYSLMTCKNPESKRGSRLDSIILCFNGRLYHPLHIRIPHFYLNKVVALFVF